MPNSSRLALASSPVAARKRIPLRVAAPWDHGKLIIRTAPWGPQSLPGDYPEKIAVSCDDQVQRAADCCKSCLPTPILLPHLRRNQSSGSGSAVL
jgi:hypothetical protein